MNRKLSVKDINSIEKIIKYKFKNKKFLKLSLTHSSYDQNSNYEKLEFLGDSLINFYSTLHIYKNYEYNNVGQLSVKKTQIINNELLSSIINYIGINKYIMVGKNVNLNTKITSDVFESISAAIFLDSNIENLFNFFNNTLLKYKDLHNKIDYKGQFVSHYQCKHNDNYDFDTKYDNSKKKFKTVILLEKIKFKGYGNNKKIAEQNAAKKAMEYLDN